MALTKIQQAKLLTAVALFFTVIHLWLSLSHAGKSPSFGTAGSAEWASMGKAGLNIGVEDEALKDFIPFDRAIDSLLITDYNVAAARIKNDQVQYDRMNYLRKVVQVHSDFAVTLFNTDLKDLADRFGWDIYNVQENLKTGDLTADLGKDSRIYQRLQLMVNRRLKNETKSVSVMISGFGLTYDDLTRGFIEFPESITLVVPKGQEYSKIITHEAKRAGKTVIQRIPEQKNIIRFEAMERLDSIMTRDFYDALRKASDRDVILLYEKQSVFDLLSAELPKLPKKGYRIVNTR